MAELIDKIDAIRRNLLSLGSKRLAILGGILVSIAALVIVSSIVLNRATRELLYTGLEKQDVARISAALREVGTGFDIGSDGASISVAAGVGAGARMMLAERGMPSGPSAGYELFDKVSALGLTSFMQDVTRLRALEGELGRSIMFLRGVKAARVHIVMGEEATFRRARQKASASVLVKLDEGEGAHIAIAIRRLVSAAVPGLDGDDVSVLAADGTVMAARNTREDISSGFHDLEKAHAKDLEQNIRNTLSPLLGRRNFQISVVVKLNGDKKQTDETVFNPDSKVERSTRVTKESQASQNSLSNGAVSVDRNLPSARPAGSDGKQASEENQKREETTNYELSSKKTVTTSNGYSIDTISVAVVVNRSVAAAEASTDQKEISPKVTELEQLVASAAGLQVSRGDSLKVLLIDFAPEDKLADTPFGIAVGDALVRNTGSIIAAFGTISIVALVLLFGLRPLLNPAWRAPMVESNTSARVVQIASASEVGVSPDIATKDAANIQEPDFPIPPRSAKKALAQRLESLVASDEDLAAAIMLQWIREPTV